MAGKHRAQSTGKKERIVIYVDEELYNSIQSLAEQENRSNSNFCATIIEKEVLKRKGCSFQERQTSAS